MPSEKTILLQVQIDSRQEIETMNRLKKDIDELDAKGKKRSVSERELQKQLTSQYNEQSKQIQNATKLQNVNENSIAGMRLKVVELKKEWANADLGSKEFIKAEQAVQKLNAALTKNEMKVGIGGRNVGNYPQALAQVAGSAGGGIGAIASGLAVGPMGAMVMAGTALVGSLSDLIGESTKFEKSLSNLKALTGASTDELKKYAESAKATGTEHGIAATKIVETYKLIAGALPELLTNRKALDSVTNSAIILSKASGLELPEAATRLTDIMAAMGIPARDAAKSIDILAAAAKASKAEIPDLSATILKSGVNAAAAGVNLQTLSAATEVLAEHGMKAENAGDKLNTIMIKLSSAKGLSPQAQSEMAKYGISADLLSDKTVSFTDKMRELGKSHGDAVTLSKIFEESNVSAARTLIDYSKRVDELNGKLGEFGVASKMASENTDNLTDNWARLKASLSNQFLSDTGILNEIVRGTEKAIGGVDGAIRNGLKTLEDNYNKFVEKEVERQSNSVKNTGDTEQKKLLFYIKSLQTQLDYNKKLTNNQKVLYSNLIRASLDEIKVLNETSDKKTKIVTTETAKIQGVKDKVAAANKAALDKSEKEYIASLRTKLDSENAFLIAAQDAAKFFANEKEKNILHVGRTELKVIEDTNKAAADARIKNSAADKKAADDKIAWNKKGMDNLLQFAAKGQKITQNIETAQTVKLQGEYDKRQQALTDQFNKGLISEKDYNEKTQALKNKQAADEKANKKKMAAFNFALTIGEIISSTAASIMGTWRGYAAGGLFGTIMAIIQTGMLGILGGTEVAIARNQYNAIKNLHRGGELVGNSHAHGGVQIEPTTFAEGGEFLSNTAATKMFKPELQFMNQLGQQQLDRPTAKTSIQPFDYELLANSINSIEVTQSDKALEKRNKIIQKNKSLNTF